MKKAFYFILGIALVILTSATTVSVMTVKPAPPKLFTVKSFGYESDSDRITKSVSKSSSWSFRNTLRIKINLWQRQKVQAAQLRLVLVKERKENHKNHLTNMIELKRTIVDKAKHNIY